MTPRVRPGAVPIRTALAAPLALGLLAVTIACGRAAPHGAGPTPSRAAPAATTRTATTMPTATATTTTAPASTTATPRSTPRPAAPKPETPKPTSTRSTPAIPSALLGQDVTRIPTTRKIVALTFDAGANADGVSSILATLARERIRATFFLTGAFVDRYPAAARSIVTAGHRVGNHSVDHPHLPALSVTEQRAQVLGAQQTIIAVTGADPRPLFRFPFGDRTTTTISVVNGLGYVAVRWTVDSLGWQGTVAQSAASVTARVLGAAVPGEIVLMHVGSNPSDGSTLDADALPGVIGGLRQRGYGFVTLDQLLGVSG